MENFTTVVVPTVLTASQAHATTSKQQPGFESSSGQSLHPKQQALMRRMFGKTEEKGVVTDPKALRSQAEPKVKISIRRRVTDALNSPFEYEMSEAARVVL